jgi:hypothetical protein
MTSASVATLDLRSWHRTARRSRHDALGSQNCKSKSAETPTLFSPINLSREDDVVSKTSTTMSIQEAVDAALAGEEHVIRCPAHEDNSPSLAVAPGKTQPVLLRCHAGCDQDNVIEAGGLDWSQVCNPLDAVDEMISSRRWTPAGEASHIYQYVDEQGTVLFEVLRVPVDNGKRFLQRRPDESAPHGHSWNLDGVRRVPWRLPQVMEATRAGRTIHIAEGEKCVEALLTAIPEGDEATCNPGGAGKWLEEYNGFFAGANVVIYADSDDVGRTHARQVREGIVGVGGTVSVKEAPTGVFEGKDIGDVADHLASGRTLEDLLETTPESEIQRARTGIDILDVILRPRGQTVFAIDNTLAMGERLILLGFEGTGKSTLCRQIAVMTAAGLHPFTGMPMNEPKKVLFIDAENHPEQVLDSWGQLVNLCGAHGHPVERGMLTVLEEWEANRDLTQENGVAWLMERIHAYEPALVVMGPLTNLAGKDLRDDEPVRKLRNAVNAARNICNSAWVMEHHAPLKGNMDKERPLRPYGSSLFLKWPDYGYGIKPTDREDVYEWHKNRGPRVRSRFWPQALREGKPDTLEFPWENHLIEADEVQR